MLEDGGGVKVVVNGFDTVSVENIVDVDRRV